MNVSVLCIENNVPLFLLLLLVSVCVVLCVCARACVRTHAVHRKMCFPKQAPKNKTELCQVPTDHTHRQTDTETEIHMEKETVSQNCYVSLGHLQNLLHPNKGPEMTDFITQKGK